MEHVKKQIMKPLSELNLLDRFLFACAMEDTGTMELVLRIILGRNIRLFDVPQAEKELRTAPWLRSIRLDVVTMDEYGIYNTEVQKRNTGNLLKRSRFYQAVMDSPTLLPGNPDFNSIPDVTLIMVAPFDLFGKGKYCYTFQMGCRESGDLWLEDGATRIFLNTRGTNPDEVSNELVELLHYFEDSTDATASRCRSERVKALHRQVCRVKSSEEVGVRYMQEWEEKAYIRAEGKEEGKTEGAKQKIMSQVAKKLLKGKDTADIAEDLEEDVSVIEAIIRELQAGDGDCCV